MTEHIVFGFSVSEWVGIVGIIGSTYALIVKPLMNKFDRLSDSIDRISQNSLIEHSRLWRHYDRHDKELWKHDQEIGILYDKTQLHRVNTEDMKHKEDTEKDEN